MTRAYLQRKGRPPADRWDAYLVVPGDGGYWFTCNQGNVLPRWSGPWSPAELRVWFEPLPPDVRRHLGLPRADPFDPLADVRSRGS